MWVKYHPDLSKINIFWVVDISDVTKISLHQYGFTIYTIGGRREPEFTSKKEAQEAWEKLDAKMIVKK